MAKADFLTGIVLMALSLYVMFEAWQMPRLEHLKVHPLSVPGLVPAFLASVILIFGMALVIRSIWRGGHRLTFTFKGFLQSLRIPGNKRLVVTAFLTIFYAVLLIGTLPYWLATGLFIFVFIILFEWEQGMSMAQRRRCILSASLIAILSSVVITLVFERLFLVTLP